jgi:hypothetical protein
MTLRSRIGWDPTVRETPAIPLGPCICDIRPRQGAVAEPKVAGGSLWPHQLQLGDVPLDGLLAWRSIPPSVPESASLRNRHHGLNLVRHGAIAGLKHPWFGLAKDGDPLTVSWEL